MDGTQASPPPWRVKFGDHDWSGFTIVDRDGRVVCEWWPPAPDPAANRANAAMICAAPALAEAIRDQIAWVERLLRQLEHRDVADARGNVVNGFAAAVVPDWELRQKLESLKEDLASTEGRDG